MPKKPVKQIVEDSSKLFEANVYPAHENPLTGFGIRVVRRKGLCEYTKRPHKPVAISWGATPGLPLEYVREYVAALQLAIEVAERVESTVEKPRVNRAADVPVKQAPPVSKTRVGMCTAFVDHSRYGVRDSFPCTRKGKHRVNGELLCGTHAKSEQARIVLNGKRKGNNAKN